MAFAVQLPARNDAAGFTSRCGLASCSPRITGTLSLRFDDRDLSRRREPRYRGPWRLLGPDSHRLVNESLSPGYAIRNLPSTQAPELLDAQLHR
jgi:hypothetical protein